MLGEIGDGTLTSFHSASDAVNCARQAQAALKDSPDLQLRIGIHLGDVLFTDDNAWGDGVNIASRIHGLAVPGSICVSATVYDEIRNKPGIVAKNLGNEASQERQPSDRGLRSFRGSRFRWRADALNPRERANAPAWLWEPSARSLVAALVYVLAMRKSFRTARHRHARPARPHLIRSIAVLPLDNYSGDPNQQYFAEGMTDELTTDLATISQLRVISRGSVMQFKGDHRPPTPQIAKLLNVDAVVEGSVLRVGDKVRITAQLIDAPADKHLWAKSYERDSRDVLALQDEVASAIAKEIEVQLTPNEQARLTSAPTVNPAAHDAYLKGRYFFARPNDENLKKAITRLRRSGPPGSDLCARLVGIGGRLQLGRLERKRLYFRRSDAQLENRGGESTPTRRQFRRGSRLTCHIQMFYEFDWVGGESEFRRAFALNPNYAFAHDQLGFVLGYQGRLDEAIGRKQARR